MPRPPQDSAGGTPHPRRAQALSLVAALAALTLAFLLARAIDARVGPAAETPSPIFLPRAEVLRPALLGFDGLAADLYWLRTVQYVGSRVELGQRFPQLYQLVDLTTSLDPQFVDAYVFGGLFISIARQYPQSVAIYEKGIRANPEAWQIPHDLGRMYYLELGDYDKALHWWEVANRLPGRPHYLPRFIARLYAKTGHRETALELWQAMRDSSTDKWVRETAEREIAKMEQGHPPARAR